MRLPLVCLILSFVMLALPNASLAQGQGAGVFQVSVDGNIVNNPCTGENVVLSGTIVSSLRFSTDGSGALHLHISSNSQGVTGVGEITGTQYRVSGREDGGLSSFKLAIGPVNGATQLTILVSFRMISMGSDDNFINNTLVHLTTNANKEVTAVVDNSVGQCFG